MGGRKIASCVLKPTNVSQLISTQRKALPCRGGTGKPGHEPERAWDADVTHPHQKTQQLVSDKSTGIVLVQTLKRFTDRTTCDLQTLYCCVTANKVLKLSQNCTTYILHTTWPSCCKIAEICEDVEKFGIQENCFACKESEHVGCQAHNFKSYKSGSEKVTQAKSYLQVICSATH